MELYNLQTMKREEGTRSPLSVALGNFDGVHKGHAELIARAVSYAKQHGIKSAVWTFAEDGDMLPNKPDARCITPTGTKLSLIRELGVDFAFLESFSAVRNLTPEQFVKQMLINDCDAACAVCGFNFRFGAGGAGDGEALRRLMSPRDCIVVPPVYVGGQLVSSSAVRKLIEGGDMEGAAQLLGRHFSLELPVVSGKKLGRRLGVPTINQNFPDGHIIPKRGIYACKVYIGGEEYIAVSNVGVRPSIEGDLHEINCETHIMGFEGELYGKDIKVAFCRRLRDEMRFGCTEDLIAQIERDKTSAREYFGERG